MAYSESHLFSTAPYSKKRKKKIKHKFLNNLELGVLHREYQPSTEH